MNAIISPEVALFLAGAVSATVVIFAGLILDNRRTLRALDRVQRLVIDTRDELQAARPAAPARLHAAPSAPARRPVPVTSATASSR